MEFELSAEQQALHDAATAVLAERSSPTRVRRVVDAGGGWDRELWADVVAQGWPGIAVPEEHGGVGLGWVEAAVLAEAMGAHIAPIPTLGHVVAADALVTADHTEPLAGMLDGSTIAAAAFRPLSASDRGGTWTLTGRTEPVLFAPSADLVVVRGSDADGDEHLFAVELDDAGRPAAEPAMDRTREVGWLDFDATPAIHLGGAEVVERYLDRGAVLHAAELLGAASRCLDLSVAYAKDRVQFGRPIGSFQAVKHRCADMLVDTEGMRSVVWWAAWCLSVDDPESHVAASAAKAWCSDAADRVAASALQVHGGIGFTWECDVHLYVKRVQLDRVTFGDAAWHRDRLAGLLRARVEAGGSVISA